MTDAFNIYFAKGKKGLRRRLALLAKKQDCSVNYLILRAVGAVLEKEKG